MNKMKVAKMLFGLLICILNCTESVYAEGFLTLPIESNVDPSCEFGCYPGHLGTDWPVSEGSYIVAPCNADVEVIQDNVPHYDFDSGIKSFGNYIKLNAGTINNHQVKIILAHLLTNSFFVGLNKHVLRGQRLALSDNSGTTTGPHLDMTVYLDGTAVNPYDSANYLWTTNPPSHASSAPLIPLLFSFPSHSSDGWTCGYDTQTTSDQDPVDQNTWKVAVQGPNPGVVSPELMAGLTTNNLTLRFSAKVRGTGPDTYCQIWIKDDSGSWSHEVRVRSVDGQSGNVVKRDYQYHEYTALLADAGNISIRQFSIELTQEANTYEEWIFDWVELSSGGAGGSPEFTPTILKTLIFPYLRGSLKAEES